MMMMVIVIIASSNLSATVVLSIATRVERIGYLVDRSSHKPALLELQVQARLHAEIAYD